MKQDEINKLAAENPELGITPGGRGGYLVKPFRHTKETWQQMQVRRSEKTARLVREQIRFRAEKVLRNPVANGSEAVAMAAGLLFEDIVLNPLAPARARRETLESIANMAKVTTRDERIVIERESERAGGLSELETAALVTLRDALMRLVRENVDGTVIDVSPSPVDTPELPDK